MAQAATLLAGPLLVKHGIDAGSAAREHPSGDASALNLTVLAYLVVAFVGFLLGRDRDRPRRADRRGLPAATCATACSGT